MTPAGIVTEVNLAQLKNVASLIVVTPADIVTEVNLAQLAKA